MIKRSILLAEDDSFLVDIYSGKLKLEGFDVEVATRGSEILEKLKERKFDLLLLDLVLPEMSGWEILKEIKKDKKFKDLKVVILSNLGERDDVEKGMRLGAKMYLIKARYTPSEVVEEIKKIIS